MPPKKKKKKKSRRKQFKAPPHSLKLLRLYGENNNKTTATKHFTAHNYGSGERFCHPALKMTMLNSTLHRFRRPFLYHGKCNTMYGKPEASLAMLTAWFTDCRTPLHATVGKAIPFFSPSVAKHCFVCFNKTKLPKTCGWLVCFSPPVLHKNIVTELRCFTLWVLIFPAGNPPCDRQAGFVALHCWTSSRRETVSLTFKDHTAAFLHAVGSSSKYPQ